MRTWSEDHPKARLLERKQEAIKEAARALFLQHGYADTTMEMVAAQSGVSIMTLYRHFRSKDILFQAVIEHLCNQATKKNAGEALWEGTPEEVLQRLGERRLAFYCNSEEVALYRVIIGALEHFPAIGKLYYDQNFEKATERLSAYFQELDQRGVLRVPDPAFSARAFLALLHGSIAERFRLGVEPAFTQDERRQHIRDCVAFFLSAHQMPTSE